MMRAAGLTVLLALLAAAPAHPEEQPWRQRPAEDMTSAKSDVEQEIIFGREIAARLIGHYRYYDNQDILRYVNLVGKTVAQSSSRPEIEFRFGVLETDEINGYAAPGGYIFITKGALAQMKDEAELAGVLSHEIVHVSEKHIVKELNIKGTEDSTVAGFARLIGGTSESARLAFSQAVDKAMDMLYSTGYKREDERSADRNALTLAAVAGYDPNGLARYLDRIAALKGKHTNVLDKTHPPYGERTALLKEQTAKDGMGEGATHADRFASAMKLVK